MPIDATVRTYETAGPEETFQIGRCFGDRLRAGDVVALIGDLGSGKTCLIQGICAGLGVEEPVTSPTFTLINDYEGRLPVSHFDLYRLDDPEALLDLGFDEYLDSGRVCLIEWADKCPALLPPGCIEVRIDIVAPFRRRIRVSGIEG
jgi:tRNA threonylcarbamoyladenosine biosynthesis protein TsaE